MARGGMDVWRNHSCIFRSRLPDRMSLTPARATLATLLHDIIAVLGGHYVLYLTLVCAAGLLEGVSLASLVPLLAAIGIGDGAPSASTGIGGLAVAVLTRLGVQPTVGSI